MSRRHPKTVPDKGADQLAALRNQVHRILSYSSLISDAADRLNGSHAVLYRYVVRGEHKHVMKCVDPKFVRKIARHLKMALDLVELVESRTNANDKDLDDDDIRLTDDPVQHQQSPADTSTSESSSSSSDSQEEDTDVLPRPPWVKAAISSSTQTVKPEPPSDDKTLEPPQLTRNDTELAQPSETNQETPSTTNEPVQALVDQL